MIQFFSYRLSDHITHHHHHRWSISAISVRFFLAMSCCSRCQTTDFVTTRTTTIAHKSHHCNSSYGTHYGTRTATCRPLSPILTHQPQQCSIHSGHRDTRSFRRICMCVHQSCLSIRIPTKLGPHVRFETPTRPTFDTATACRARERATIELCPRHSQKVSCMIIQNYYLYTNHVVSSWPRPTTRRPTVSTPVRWGPAASRFPVTQRPSSTGSYVTTPRSSSNQPYRVTVPGPITGRGSPPVVVGGKVTTTTVDDSFYPPRDPARIMYLNIKQDRSPGGAFNPRPIHADQSVVVETTSGRIRGVKGRAVSKWVFAFLGIPYADAPVDTLRFKRTQPIKPWQVRNISFSVAD